MNKMIKLTEFLSIKNSDKVKVKFNMNPGDSSRRAWDLLLEDHDDWMGMNKWKTKHPNNNLNKAEYLLAFAQYYPYGPEYFIFGGMFKVKDGGTPGQYNVHGYELEKTGKFEEYEKRLIIKLARPIGRDLYNRWYQNLDSLEPEVFELAPRTKLGPFPGYQNVSIKHKDLQAIVNKDEPSWKQPLSHVKGVYLITDMETGKLYVGSASGNADGIWQRWSVYANCVNPTGGNDAFVELMKMHGSKYIINNFKYTILEIFDTKTKGDDIRAREQYWKDVFSTKIHGNNRN